MSVLRVRLQQDLVDESSQILANIYSLTEDHTSESTRTVIRNVPIPAGQNTVLWKKFSLAPGRYLVEAALPSGETVTEDVSLEDTDQHIDVPLQGPRSAHEWLRWHFFTFGTGRFSASTMDAVVRELPSRSVEFSVDLLVLPQNQPLMRWEFVKHLLSAGPMPARGGYPFTFCHDCRREDFSR